MQVRDREPSLGRGAKVVAVSLDKVSIQSISLNPNVKPRCPRMPKWTRVSHEVFQVEILMFLAGLPA
jgi:hypothetical protein